MMPNETTNTSILTLDSDAKLETAQSISDLTWHEIQNAYRTRRILTGMLGGIEKTENGSLIAVVYYKDFRAVIPVTEMMIHLMQDEAHDYGELALRQNKILNNMLGCEIDFLIKGLDSKTRSIVASRKEAMLKKRQIFYLDKDANGMPKVYEDRIVQARVIAVAEKVVRAKFSVWKPPFLPEICLLTGWAMLENAFRWATTSWYASWMWRLTHQSRLRFTQM